MTPEDQEREQAIRARVDAAMHSPHQNLGELMVARQDIPWLLDRLTEERELREALERWKREAMLVLAEYDAIVDLLPSGRLGSSKMATLRTFVERALQEQELREALEKAAVVVLRHMDEYGVVLDEYGVAMDQASTNLDHALRALRGER